MNDGALVVAESAGAEAGNPAQPETRPYRRTPTRPRPRDSGKSRAPVAGAAEPQEASRSATSITEKLVRNGPSSRSAAWSPACGPGPSADSRGREGRPRGAAAPLSGVCRAGSTGG